MIKGLVLVDASPFFESVLKCERRFVILQSKCKALKLSKLL